MRTSKPHSILVSLAICLSTIVAQPALATNQCDLVGVLPSGTPGTLLNPYRISTEQELNEIRDCDLVNLDAATKPHFLQINDISLTAPWDPIPNLSGDYNGGGHWIRNLSIVGGDELGLFKQTWPGSKISYLNLEVVGVRGGHSVGALVGVSYGELSNIHVQATQPGPVEIVVNNFQVQSGQYVITHNAGFALPVGTLLELDLGLRTDGGPTHHRVIGSPSPSQSNILERGTPPSQVPLEVSAYLPTVFGTGPKVGLIAGSHAGQHFPDIDLSLLSALELEWLTGTGNVAGTTQVGGLFGEVSQGALKNVSFSGAVSGTDQSIGGIIGISVNSSLKNEAVAPRTNAIVAGEAVQSGEQPIGLGGLVGQLVRVTDYSRCSVAAIKGLGAPLSASVSSGSLSLVFPYTPDGISVSDTLHVYDSLAANATLQGTGILGQVQSVGPTVVVQVDSALTPTTDFATHTLSSAALLSVVSSSMDSCPIGVVGGQIKSEITSFTGPSAHLSAAGGVVGLMNYGVLQDVEAVTEIYADGDEVGGHVGRSWRSSLRSLRLSPNVAEPSLIQGRSMTGGVVGRYFGMQSEQTPAQNPSQPTLQVIAIELEAHNATVTSRSTAAGQSPAAQVGGLIGEATNLILTDSTASTKVLGGSVTGGLVGYGENTSIFYSGYTGTEVRGLSGVGGIVGEIYSSSVSGFISLDTNIVVVQYDGDNNPLRYRISTLNDAPHYLSSGQSLLLTSGSSLSYSPMIQDIIVVDDHTLDFVGSNQTFGIDPAVGFPVGSELRPVSLLRNTGTVRTVDRLGDLGVSGTHVVGGIAGEATNTHFKNAQSSLQAWAGSDNVYGVGGVVGLYSAASGSDPIGILDSYSSAPIRTYGVDSTYGVGGIAGEMNYGMVVSSEYSGDIVARVAPGEVTDVGGAIGKSSGADLNLVAVRADIETSAGESVGGLVGREYIDSTIAFASYFQGDINAPASDGVGGLYGTTNANVDFMHASGSISGNSDVGGLVGYAQGSDITRSFYSGTLSRGVPASIVNEAVGNPSFSGVSDLFWNSNLISSAAAGGKTVEELNSLATFAGWGNFQLFYSMPDRTKTTWIGPVISELAYQPYDLRFSTSLSGLSLQVGQPAPSIRLTSVAYPAPVLTLVSGNLPPGLTIQGDQLVGTPTTPGVFTFSLAAENTEGLGPTSQYSLTVTGQALGGGSGGGGGAFPILTPPATGVEISLSPSRVSPGQVVTVIGLDRGDAMTVLVGEKELDLLPGDTVSFRIPLGFEPGIFAVELPGFDEIDLGELEIQGPAFWTKRTGNNFRFYAKNIVTAGKITFHLNGREIAWVRAQDELDPKLREANGFYYLVRSGSLRQGRNVLEIFKDGERVRRVIYSLRD